MKSDNINGDLIERVKHWIELAEEDLSVAKHSLTISSNVPYRIIAFHSQQCAEKYIKALLVLYNIDFPYTHDIEKLLQMTPGELNLLPQLLNAGDLTDYAVAKRYPDY
jgi:HEPN domain-containing protein